MKQIITCINLFFVLTPVIASDSDSLNTKADSAVYEPGITFLDKLDSMAAAPYFTYHDNIIDTAFTGIDSFPVFSDSIIEARLEELNLKTPFNISYNKRVHAFIKLYTEKRREQSSKMLGLAEYYFPMFEEILDFYDMPYELKYLAVVESALNPRARSRAGAVGIWQFMYSTGKMYNLEQNSYMDERMDPVKSTHAACKYLSYLYQMYGKWDLALAAYNCGPGNVNKAIRRSGKTTGNYWDIYPFLPRETRGYVPAFVAAHYTFSYAEEHGITPIKPAAYFFETDTTHVSAPIEYDLLSEHLHIDIETLRFLNPSYKRDRVPAYSNKTSILRLPRNKLIPLGQNLDTIAALTARRSGEENNGRLKEFTEDRVYYTVRSGDYLGKIAGRYGVSSRQIMAWNNMRSTRINIGQKLVIYPRGGVSHSNNTQKKKKKITPVKEGDKEYYEVRSGDTLWDISGATGVPVSKLKEWNTNINAVRLKPGMKIIIGNNG